MATGFEPDIITMVLLGGVILGIASILVILSTVRELLARRGG